MRRFIGILSLILSTFFSLLAQDASLNADSTLSEKRLDARILTITLGNGEYFTDTATLAISNFTLVNEPTGTSIHQLNALDTNQVELSLAFNGTDFDATILDFQVSIENSTLVVSASDLLTNTLPVVAYLENPQLNINPDSTLTEKRLDARYLDLSLSEESFTDYTILSTTDFALNNEPTGATIESVTGLSESTARLDLQFDGTDFDANIFDFNVSISAGILVQTSSGQLFSNNDTIFATVENPVASLVSDSILSERSLDRRHLTIDLTDEEFLDYTSLINPDFLLVNPVAGLQIESVTGLSPTSARIDLQFDGTDFDVNQSNFYVRISSSVLLQTTSGYLSTNTLNIQAFTEPAQATLGADSTLTEWEIQNRTLNLSLEDEQFTDYTSLDISNFTLRNAPTGLSVGSVTGTSATTAEITLNFSYNDFDTDYNNFSLSIDAAELTQTSTGTLISNILPIIAYVENPFATLTSDSVMEERTLDQRYLTISLDEEEFINFSTLASGDFTLLNAVSGLQIESVNGLSKTGARINLQFSGTDFDATVTDFRVQISQDVLVQSNLADLNTTSLSILAYAESPQVTIQPDSTLSEKRLDVRYLTINLSEESFVDYTSLSVSDFSLNNEPSGLTIESVIGQNPNSARLDLAYNGADFDTDIPDFNTSIQSAVLVQTNSGSLNSNDISIIATQENPLATLAADSVLAERTLDRRHLTIDLTDEEFLDYTSLINPDFLLVNPVAGLQIESVTGLSPTSARIDLQFDGTDFDANESNFFVRVSSSVLWQTQTGYLTTNPLNIQAYSETPVASLSADSTLSELAIEKRILTIDLDEELFLDHTALNITNFNLVNAPTGLSIQSVTGISSTTAEIKLSFAYTDFDTDINDFSISINASELVQTSSGTLVSTSLPIIAYPETPAAAMNPDSALAERSLDRRYLTLSLDEEEFVDYTSLAISDISLVNAVAGLGIESVAGLSNTSARIELQFNDTDFDSDVLNFYVAINAAVLVQTKTGTLASSQSPLLAYNETPVLNLDPDSTLSELSLSRRNISLLLTEEQFVDFTSLLPSEFTLYNAPAGMSIESVNGTTPTSAIIELRFDGTDFDASINDFYIGIVAGALTQTASGTLFSDQLTIVAYTENPAASLSADSVLSEYRIAERTLYLDLDEETFLDHTSLQIADFTLLNPPTGLSMQSVTGLSSTRVAIELSFSYNDFDLTITDFGVQISKDVLVQSDLTDLTSSQLSVIAYVETPQLTIQPDSVLSEPRLDVRYLNISLFEENFIDHTNLSSASFSLNNEPSGLTIEKITGLDPSKARLEMSYEGVDFDTDITDFNLSIQSAILLQTTSGSLTSNNENILAYIEQPVLQANPDSVLSEPRLDIRSIELDLSEESFADYTSLSTADFNLVNPPAGLSIEGVTGQSPTQASIQLAFDQTDFDQAVSDFRIQIDRSVLVQSTTSNLSSQDLTILAYVESPAFTIAPDSALTEYRLDQRSLLVNLNEESFTDFTALSVSQFSLTNIPAGLTLEAVNGLSPTQAELDLAFTYNDFDVDYPDLRLIIDKTALVQSSGSDLLSDNTVNIESYTEIPVASLSADSVLSEYGLHNRVLTIELFDEKFTDHNTLQQSYFNLSNEPQGLTIGSLTGIDPTRAELSLDFDGTDFDTNIADFYIEISSFALLQTEGPVLSSDSLTISAFTETPSATLIADSVLNENTLERRTLSIDLSQESFLDYPSLQINDFELLNEPSGLSIESVNGLSETRVDIDLTFNDDDFDANISNFGVSITASVLKQTPSGFLSTSQLALQAYDENPEANLTADSVLSEKRLASRTLYIDFIEEEFIDYTSLATADFNLVNAPAGLSIEQVNGVNPKQASIEIDFDETDFDATITDFYLSIPEAILYETTSGSLNTSQLSIIHYAETPVASLTADSVLSETRLDSRYLFVNLTEEEFLDPPGLTPSDFFLVNPPSGLTIDSVWALSSREVRIGLAFNKTDFEVDIIDFALGIQSPVLEQTESGTLVSNTMTILAYSESPVATLTADSSLHEFTLDERKLNLALSEEEFIDYTALQITDFNLANAVTGLEIESVTGLSPVNAQIELQYDGTDFDGNITNFAVNIAADILFQTPSDVLSSSRLSITAYVEQPEATLSSDSVLRELRLDYRKLTVQLTEEELKDYNTLATSDFQLVNAPTGLSIESVTGISPVSFEIKLQFDETDFDALISDFQVNINADILIQTLTGYLATSQLSIQPYLEDPDATLTADSVLTEYRIASRILNLEFNEEKFTDYTQLNISDFQLNNAPQGLSIRSVAGISPTEAEITLDFIYQDFDQNITDFSITTKKEILVQSVSNDLQSNDLTLFAYLETPGCQINADSVLSEHSLDRRSLTIQLSEEAFFDYTTLNISSFTLNNEPNGLTIEEVTGLDSNTARLDLAYEGVDFDANINDFNISISGAALVQTAGPLLTSNSLQVRAYLESPVANCTADSTLVEQNLDRSELTITLSEEQFENFSALEINDFQLVNPPSGLIIEAATGLSEKSARLDLAFDQTDFDVAITDFYVIINRSVLVQSTTNNLSTNELTIVAYIENPVANIQPDSVMREHNLDGRILNLELTEESFTDYTLLTTGDFTLNNEPQGLQIQSVTGNTETNATITLSFIYKDFDNDIFDLSVSIDHQALTEAITNLTTNQLTVFASDESPGIIASPDSILHEYSLGSRSISLILQEEEFTDHSNLQPSDFSLQNEPSGLVIEDVINVGPASAEILLDYTGLDFDQNITDFAIVIRNEVLLQSAFDLSSNSMIIEAYEEIPAAAVTEDSVLYEPYLNRRSIQIKLIEDQFTDHTSLVNSNFQLRYEPAGLSIEKITGQSETEAILDLAFDNTDFDIEYPDFHLRISKSVLLQSNTSDLITDTLTIYPKIEIPVLEVIPDSILSEFRLDQRSLKIELTEEEFIGPSFVTPNRFTLINAPAGLSIEQVNYNNKQEIFLEFVFTGQDFDEDYEFFHISIDSDILVQSATDLYSDSIPILHNFEPVVTGVSIPDTIMKVGDIVPVAVFVAPDQGNIFSLDGGTIGGFTISNLTRNNDTLYQAFFTVQEGGNDYQKADVIPVSDLRLLNGVIPGNAWNEFIDQANDLLDANSPVIEQVSAISSGKKNIGSEIQLLITADQPGYSFHESSTCNGISLSDSRVTISDIGSGNYNLKYIIAENDSAVEPGNLPISLVAIDIAGNQGSTFTNLSTNDISIDAVRPDLFRAYISSSDMNVKVDEIVEITVEADAGGYLPATDTWINDVFIDDPNIIFSDLGNGIYKFTYIVKDADGSVSEGNLAINIVLADEYNNRSLNFTNLDPNTLSIFTSRPSAAISGSNEICKGDSTLITINFGGVAPWEIELSDGTSTRIITDIQEGTYQFFVSPDATSNYTIPRVSDATANSNNGIGRALITVYPLPEVEILNLPDIYDVEGDPIVLDVEPEGGFFSGPGVTSTVPYTFFPEDAGIENSPHEILYTYSDANGCIGRDTVLIEIIAASGQVLFEKPVACFNDTSILITGSNAANTVGTFNIDPFIEGALISIGDNQARLNPEKLNISQDLTLDVSYTYIDTTGIEFTVVEPILVEKLNDARILNADRLEICSNAAPVELQGNYVGEGVFSGPGVTGSPAQGYTFYPDIAQIGSNKIVYTYNSIYSCTVRDSIILINYQKPIARFETESNCIDRNGGTISFMNDSEAFSGTLQYSWNFDDINSGANNFSMEEEPTHFYNKLNPRNVQLTVTDEEGCQETLAQMIELHPNPTADFSWSSECLNENPIELEGIETLYSSDSVTSREWRFYNAGMTDFERIDSLKNISYQYDQIGNYKISYKITTNFGCTHIAEKTIDLSPTYNLAEESYINEFEYESGEWRSKPLNPGSSQNSWILEQPTSDRFPYNAASGQYAWVTRLPNPEAIENSAVYSPCFNFKNTKRPMLSMDIKRSMDNNREGGAIQYSTDEGRSWQTLGDPDDGGINWYNSNMINNGPGGQGTGWTGIVPFQEDPTWQEVSHQIDDLAGNETVRFRIAYGSAGDNTIRNEGFAFDNFRILERKRFSVIEYFTNANNLNAASTDESINSLVNENYMDIIDVQYHTNNPTEDKFYTDNPIPGSSRGIYYGTAVTPFALIDGGIFDENLGYTRTYDFETRYPSSIDIERRSLVAPEFEINIDGTNLENSYQISLSIQALKDHSQRELSLYAIVLEKLIDDPDYIGQNSRKSFRNVARKLLPDASGITFNKGWTMGEKEQTTITWSEPFTYLNEENVLIVLLLQDENSGEILQAALSHEGDMPTSDNAMDEKQENNVLIYPNPAESYIVVDLNKTYKEPVMLNVFSMSGSKIMNTKIPSNQRRTELNMEHLQNGIYIIEVSTPNTAKLYLRTKLVVF